MVWAITPGNCRPLADVHSPEVRSRNMARIGPADTKPELIIRRGLHRLGRRFRLGRQYRHNGKHLPGKPDLIFPGSRSVIFVNGCFWHGHDCALFRWPASGENTDKEKFWRTKISGNIARDRKVRDQLLALGWRVLEVWECTLKGRNRRPADEVLHDCVAFLEGNERCATLGGDQTVTAEASA